MFKTISNSIFVLLIIFFTACGTKKEQQQSKTDSLATDSTPTGSNQVIESETLPAESPEWFRHLPQKKGVLYARGTAISSNRTVAEEKAMFRAQKELAELVEKQQNETGSGAKMASDDEEIISEIQLNNFRVLNQQKVQEGNKWRAYVLLELKVVEQE